jgi:hypothetical protein
MTYGRRDMDRRNFLIKSSSFLLGNLFGLNGFSKAYGKSEKREIFRPKIALIIDDIGCSVCRARRFLELKEPITYSILPRLSYSHDLALEIYRCGHEIMVRIGLPGLSRKILYTCPLQQGSITTWVPGSLRLKGR